MDRRSRPVENREQQANNVNWLADESGPSGERRGRTANQEEPVRVRLQSRNGLGKTYIQKSGEEDKNYADRVNTEREAEAPEKRIPVTERLYKYNVQRARNPENDGERKFKNLTHSGPMPEDFEPEVYVRHRPKITGIDTTNPGKNT